MNKHTPGPWMFTSNIREGGIARIMPAYRQRYCIATIPTGNDKDAKEADARLIAAAPELLVWLKWALDRLNESARASGQHDMAREVIAKATGGKP